LFSLFTLSQATVSRYQTPNQQSSLHQNRHNLTIAKAIEDANLRGDTYLLSAQEDRGTIERIMGERHGERVKAAEAIEAAHRRGEVAELAGPEDVRYKVIQLLGQRHRERERERASKGL
jgi:hypothetical protein